MLLGVLAACSPPPELAKPETPPDAGLRDLLPPGRMESALLPNAEDGSAVRTGLGRFSAYRFASVAAALAGLDGIARSIEGRREVNSRSSMNYGSARYLRYGGNHLAGMAWTSGNWVFVAETATATDLTALVSASNAGGLGAEGDMRLARYFPWIALGVAILGLILTQALIMLALRAVAVAPVPGVRPVSADELRRQLKALNAPDHPYLVREGPEADLVAEWKYADSAWWGVLSKAGVTKSYRLRLGLDEKRRRVTALDEFGSIEWEAGAVATPHVHFAFSFFRGVALVKYERGVAYGFRTPTGGVGKTLDYRFDMMELKQPVIDIVTGAGWRFQPALWPYQVRH